MSVVDELYDLERRVAGRMKELRPLVDEYRELERVASRLGLDGAGSVPAPDAPKRAPRPRHQPPTPATQSATGRPAATRQPRQANPSPANPSPDPGRSARRSQVLDAVKQHPGITVREIGERLGVDYTSLYRHVRALEDDGQIKKRGRTLRPG